jgi:D-serine deaminase-like pyridoxal phosphate-dependent protein
MTEMSTTPSESSAIALEEPFGTRYRSWPDPTSTRADVPDAGVSVLDLLLPAMTLRQAALAHNAALMARWCRQVGCELAPHGKTSMSPELMRLQLDAGAWAITAATAGQARMFAAWGVPRVLIANEVTDPGGLRWLGRAVADGLDVLVLVDSEAAVRLLDQAMPAEATLPVLLELGVAGGRAGCRTVAQARAVAEAVQSAQRVRLAGVECFEGVAGHDRSAADTAAVAAMLAPLGPLMVELAGAGLFAGLEEVIVSAGGSSYPDLVVAAFDALPALPGLRVRRVLRSGGYLAHDHGMLERTSPMRTDAHHPAGTLQPALRLFASVQSTPEPGLAIVGFGKRDAPFDVDLPVPLRLCTRAGRLDGVQVRRLNDQHAFVRHDRQLEVGDVVEFGISHPCTAFDKWSLLPVLDEHDRVVDVVTTCF